MIPPSRKHLFQLSKEEILRGAGLVLKNAEGLLRVGRVHVSKPDELHLANAMFQFTIEEVGKAMVLCEHYRNLYLGLPIDEGALKRAFSSHGYKTLRSLTILEEVFKRIGGPYSEGLTIITELKSAVAQYESKRQQSLYVDFDGDGFRSPQESITMPVVEHTLIVANAAYNFANEYHMKLVDPSYKFLSRTTERIRKAGGPVSADHVLQRLRKP